jgi:cytochrome P450
LLPKGTVIFVNVWGLHHDESKFTNPDSFDPDHYKNHPFLASEYANTPDYENRDHYGYGLCSTILIFEIPLMKHSGNGRRLCPGIHLADRNLFHAISKMLWAFKIEKGSDPETGQIVDSDTSMATGYREGLTACPYEFPIKLTVRSQKRRETIMKEFENAQENIFPQFDKSDFFK